MARREDLPSETLDQIIAFTIPKGLDFRYTLAWLRRLAANRHLLLHAKLAFLRRATIIAKISILGPRTRLDRAIIDMQSWDSFLMKLQKLKIEINASTVYHAPLATEKLDSDLFRDLVNITSVAIVRTGVNLEEKVKTYVRDEFGVMVEKLQNRLNRKIESSAVLGNKQVRYLSNGCVYQTSFNAPLTAGEAIVEDEGGLLRKDRGLYS